MRDADILNDTLVCALRGLAGDYDEMPVFDTTKGPKLHDPENDAYVKYGEASILFDKRYAKDMTEYNIIQGT